MSGIILSSRALEDRPIIVKQKKSTKRKTSSRRPRVSKRRNEKLSLQYITETVKSQLKQLNTADFVVTDPIAGEKDGCRYDQLLKVNEQHLEKMKNVREKCLNLEKENETIKSSNARSLNALEEKENDLRSHLDHERKTS